MHKIVYLAPANMHTNHLLAYSDCHYCKKYYKNHPGIEARQSPLLLIRYLCYYTSASASGNNKDILLMWGLTMT